MSENLLSSLLSEEEIEFEVEEIKFNLPTGGFISGKWWGDKSIRPFVCLHGWLDNAGTFDRLIPLLPREFSYLAIDLPGHGRSSFLPNGVPYHTFDNLYVLSYLMKEYNWDKLSIIAHSMGANVAFIYAGIFPNKIDILISIDVIKPISRDTNALVRDLEDSLNNFMVADSRNRDKSESPAYTIDEMVERLYNGSFKSVTKECAPYLLKRSIVPSKKYPGKFCFSKDGRLKHDIGFNLSLSTYVDLARKLKMPYLVVKGGHVPIPEKKSNYDAVLNALKESNKFEYFEADSDSHHLHLTEPEKVAGVMESFIKKHKRLQSQL